MLVSLLPTFMRCSFSVASPGSDARAEGHKTAGKLFVSCIMTQNYTMNKVHVAATELQQLLS